MLSRQEDVVRAHRVVIDAERADADVVVVRAHGDVLASARRIATREDRDDIARLDRLRGEIADTSAKHASGDSADVEALDRVAEQGERGRGADLEGQRAVLGRRRHREPPEGRIDRDRWQRGQDEDDAEWRLVERRQVSPASRVGPPIRKERDREHDELAGARVGTDQRFSISAKSAAVDDRDASRIECQRKGGRFMRYAAGPERQGRAIDRQVLRGIEAARYHGYVLQIAAAVPRWLESHALELGGDIVGGFDVAPRSWEPASHGVVR